MSCFSMDGPDSSTENELRGFGQHFQSASVLRDPTSPPCHQGLSFRVPEPPPTVTIPHVRCVECSLPFPLGLLCEGSPKTFCVPFVQEHHAEISAAVGGTQPLSGSCSCCHIVKWGGKWSQQRLICLNTAHNLHFPLSPRDGSRAGAPGAACHTWTSPVGALLCSLGPPNWQKWCFLPKMAAESYVFRFHVWKPPGRSGDTSLHGVTCLLHVCGGRAAGVLCCGWGAAWEEQSWQAGPGRGLEPAPDQAPRCSWQQSCQKTTEECEICFLGKELTPGARNTALLPSLLWPGPITCLSGLAAVQQGLCQSLLLPPVLSGLQGKTVLNSSLGSLSLLWEVSLVSGCSECAVEINRVWKTTESFWKGMVCHCFT